MSLGRQFGFRITGFPEGNPNLSAETQRQAGIVGKETYYPYDPEADDQTENPITQVGEPLFNENYADEDRERYPEGVTRYAFRGSPSKWSRDWDARDKLFDPTDYDARPQDQTPDAWLKRPDVMFHTGMAKAYERSPERQVHFGTATAGLQIAGPSGIFGDKAKSTDTIARRIPDAHQYPAALDYGAQEWAEGMEAQYQNVAEDAESVSVITHADKTKSWVDDQREGGRFSDYAEQLHEVARRRQDGTDDPDTSFHFQKHETSKEVHRRRWGQEMPSPGMVNHQRLRPSNSENDVAEWTHTWNEAVKPQGKIRPGQ